MIRLEQVTKTFEGAEASLTAVRDISVAIQEGRFACVVGPSGCGKSTLLGMIAGLIPITSGRIELNGRHVDGVPRATASKVGWIWCFSRHFSPS